MMTPPAIPSFRAMVRAAAVAIGLQCSLATTAIAQDFQVIHRFGPPFGVASVPMSLMQATDGFLYGSTLFSGYPEGGGIIFKMTTQGQIINSWPGTALTPLIGARNGDLYALLAFQVVRVKVDTEHEVVHEFDYLTEGTPRGGLVEGADGNIYGTTFDGGESGHGAIYRLTPGGAITWLHSFDGAHGARPESALIQAADGNFYGTTVEGGESGLGTAFKMSPDGTVIVLHHFSGTDGDGATPLGALVQVVDGSFYGATSEGGEHGHGTIFRMTADGTLTTVFSFSGGLDGSGPRNLIATSDGRVCGTTERNVSSRLYCITQDGAFKLLHTMTLDDGYGSPGLVHGFDGYFYGVGTSFVTGGTVFRLRNPSPCDDAIALVYRENSLDIGITIRSETPAFSGAWLAFNSTVVPFWTTVIPAITPAVFVHIPIPGFPSIANVGVLTWLATSTGNVCVDWKTIDTGGSGASVKDLLRTLGAGGVRR